MEGKYITVRCDTCKTVYDDILLRAHFAGKAFCGKNIQGVLCPGYAYAFEEKGDEDVPKLKTPAICFVCKKSFCEICNSCETMTCTLNGKTITSKSQMISAGLFQAHTQKALGFMQLQHKFGLQAPTPYFIVSEPDDIESVQKFDAFIRPCPVRPRHGFVESRRAVSERAIIQTIWDEARAEDPEAELIVCKAINAKYNAIFTPSMLAVGPGNAGATGGHESVSIPLMGVLPQEVNNIQNLKVCGVDYSIDDPYLEVVKDSHTGSWFYTQLRAGTKVPKAPDYVPEKLRVEKILVASGDLLEWEKQVRTIEKGTVVVHVGGTLISHYGVHCVTNKIPIFTTRVPDIGEVLEKVGAEVQHEPGKIVKGLALGAMIPTNSLNNGPLAINHLLPMMMTILHNAPAMGNGYGVWVGFAVSIMMRAGMAASHGEARHANAESKANYTRAAIYEIALRDFIGCRNTLGKAQYEFLYYKWGSSFGGKKWAACTQSIFDLDNTARALMRVPNEANRVALVNALNTAVNQAHNGGWWLNKFIPQDYFTAASQQSVRALERVADTLIPVNDYFKSVPDGEWKALAFKWAGLPDITVEARKVEAGAAIGEDYSNYDKSVNIDPNCCGDCKAMYKQAIAKKVAYIHTPTLTAPTPANKAAGISIGEKLKALDLQPIPIPAYKTASKEGKKKSVYKVAFKPGMKLEKAHVRFEGVGDGQIGVHVQCMVVGTQPTYCSWDIVMLTKNILNNPTSTLPYEQSYSSDAGGYLDMAICKVDSTWTFTEEHTGAVFELNKAGEFKNVAAEQTKVPDAEEKEIETLVSQ